MTNFIEYKQGYKYQLSKDHASNTGITGYDVNTQYLRLLPSGILYIDDGYAWDGPSGPAIDTSNFMRGSLVHDAIYQLIRDGHLPSSCRSEADNLLREHCMEDGMSWVRAWWVHKAVKYFARKAALPSRGRTIKKAP